MTTKPAARHVDEPQKAMPLPDPRPELWENFTNYVGALLVCAKHNIAVIDALLAAKLELAQEVERLKGEMAIYNEGARLAQEQSMRLIELRDADINRAEAAEKRAEQAESRALAAQKDAERYRWLKSENKKTFSNVAALTFNVGHDWQGTTDLDAAIDAAAK